MSIVPSPTADYTITIQGLVESGFNLGMDDYELFDETYRSTLNTKILNHFYFREIGFETPDKFAWYLNNTLREIMPYYNQLYESQTLEVNPLISFEHSETRNEETDTLTEQDINVDSEIANDTVNQTIESQTRNLDITQDTLEDGTQENDETLKNLDTAEGAVTTISDGYLTSVKVNERGDVVHNEQGIITDHDETKAINSVVTGEATNTGNTITDNDTSQNEKKVTTATINGFKVPQTTLLKLYRSTFMNIDLLIMGELENLFMGVYTIGSDNYGSLPLFNTERMGSI